MTAGYSGTPLVRKLGIKPGARVGVRHAPARFADLLVPWPAGAAIVTPATGQLDVLIVFARSAAVLDEEFAEGTRVLAPAGMLWAAWPKKASKVTTDLTEARVMAIGLGSGLVDVKVCAIDETWSGLKFVRRLADRPAAGGGAHRSGDER